jgi:hypothetical protein
MKYKLKLDMIDSNELLILKKSCKNCQFENNIIHIQMLQLEMESQKQHIAKMKVELFEGEILQLNLLSIKRFRQNFRIKLLNSMEK